jgi:general secretion pathway protein F
VADYIANVRVRTGVQKIQIFAKSKPAAIAQAAKHGQLISIRKSSSFFGSIGALTPGDRQIFFSRMSAMLASKVGTSGALSLMRTTFNGKIQEISGRLLTYVESGEDFGDALARIGAPDFPLATIALIQAGSRSGETWKAIRDAADFEYQLHNAQKTAAKGLYSGIFGFVFAGIMTCVSTLYVGPKIMTSDMIKMASTADAPIDIGWVTTAGNVMGIVIGVLLFLGLVMGLFSLIGRKIFPVAADNVILKIPFYKDLVLARNNFVVLYGLGLLLRSGVRTEVALSLSAASAPRGALRSDLNKASLAVKTGRPWPGCLRTLHPTDRAALLCAVDREQIAGTFNTLANQYRELYSARLATFVPTINIIAALFLSLSGGVLFAESILPMLMASKNML